MASKVNYLIINKQGTCYHKQDTVFANALKWYIKNYVGFSSGCKIDETSWSTISSTIPAGNSTQNYNRINFFNSICTKSGFQVKKVVYNHTVLYPAPATPEELPAEITSFFIVTEGGKYFSYAATTLSDALKQYTEENLIYNSTFAISEALWDSLDQCTTDDQLKINTFNSLCKQSRNKIATIVINTKTIYTA